MSNIVDLLEAVGQDARLRHASANEMNEVLDRAEIDPEMQAAILTGDQPRLESLLASESACNLVPNITCLMLFGTETEEDEGELRQCA